MLRLTFACLCLFVLKDGTESFGSPWKFNPFGQHFATSNVEVDYNQRQDRQYCLLNLLIQVHKPLLHEELIAMGSQLNDDPNNYREGTWRFIKDFQERVHQNRMPGPFAIFNQLDEEMPQNLLGVYRFLTMALDWYAFQRNACYARIHFHPLLFVNALQMAVEEREDTKDLRMPAMYEVLPQLYFEKEVILAAQEITWNQLTPIRLVTSKRSWMDILLAYRKPKQSWTEAEPIPTDPQIIDNERKVAYLSLDLELNSHWNSLVNRLIISIEEGKERSNEPLIVDGDRLVAFRGSFDEVNYINQMALGSHSYNSKLYVYNLHQFVAALTMEYLATGQRSVDLIDPPLMTTGGVSYKGTSLNAEAVKGILDLTMDDLKTQIEMAVRHNNDSMDDLSIAGAIIGTNYLHICRQLSLAVNGHGLNQPTMLGSATSNLRDPIYRSLLLRINELLQSYEYAVLFPDAGGREPPKVVDIQVSRLVTFEEYTTTDLINLIDQQLILSQRNNLQFLRRRLVAGQRRLNHEAFSIRLDIVAPENLVVEARMYLTLPDQSRPRLHLDSFKCSLNRGLNQFERLFPTAIRKHTLGDLYDAGYPSTDVTTSNRFPSHLLLPRGTGDGLKVQLLVELTAWNGLEAEFDGVSVPILARALKDVRIFHSQA